ncbi:uncharacterized protein DUF4126 [Roseimicrobium gellanilyticum]|uniref:Uncharacterized protein DUF4126 n=1 Tax=Roseimicrobium gellanilyticum TaxID=748857 RepID=A0A366H2Z7_9BACT|nr:DUF4126 domain-containing protein [Roseimicrobium gellanilyticum]RBP36317.1 uncharacterized protein DUF4126 [Roseimicrobium gellanilyticum]
MHILDQLGVALGLATLAGVNLYLTVFLTGLAVRFDWLHLAQQHQALEVLGHPVVLIVAGLLFAMEFLADKIPWVDSMWDSVHTFIRPVGGVLLSLQAVGDMPVYVQVAAALVAGGAALTTHTAKAGTRLAVNHSPEPVSNITLSVAEDAGVAGGVALTLMHPAVALAVFTVILVALWLLLPRLWRSSKTTMWLMWQKVKLPARALTGEDAVELRQVMNNPLRDLLRIHGSVEEGKVQVAVRCLTARCKGVKGLMTNLDGVLVLSSNPDAAWFAATKGLRDRLFPLPLTDASVRVESRFLSENLVIEGSAMRGVFRFHRGQRELVEAVLARLNEMLTRHKVEPVASEAVIDVVAATKEPVEMEEQKDVEKEDARPKEEQERRGGVIEIPAT